MTPRAVRRLTLSHFRSHRLTEIAVSRRIVAIHGPNGAGKTNVLEALSLLSPGRGLRGAAAADMARRPEAIGWKIAARLETPEGPHEIETRAEPPAPRQTRIDGEAVPQNALGELVRMAWLTPAMDRLWSGGSEGRRRFLDRMTLSFDPGHADRALAYDKALRERNRLLKSQVRDEAWYAALEDRMAQAGAAIFRARARTMTLLAEATDADSAFPAADLTLLPGTGDADPADAGALAQALALGRRDDLRAGRTLIGAHRADLQAVYAAKSAPADQCSTGEQKALLISLVLANARALTATAGAPPVLLLDEVAAHLDADRRARLYDEIEALGAQAWMTGTEAALFAGLGGRADLVEMAETGGESRVASSGG